MAYVIAFADSFDAKIKLKIVETDDELLALKSIFDAKDYTDKDLSSAKAFMDALWNYGEMSVSMIKI